MSIHTTDKSNEQDTCQSGQRCETCCELIPPSSGLSQDVRDVIYHFCGPDCLERWQNREASGPAPE